MLDREFFLGFIKIHILYHASKETIFGVEIAEELARHGYSVSPGTLYPTLHRLEKAGQTSGDFLWSMPSGSKYLEQMKSKIADLKNVGGREGSSCTAAAFLGQFVGDIPWAHVDIAGVADTDKEKPYRSVGATGFGVRLVLEYLRGL